jgi:hypothetical protein
MSSPLAFPSANGLPLPVLVRDMVRGVCFPLRIWERAAGSANGSGFGLEKVETVDARLAGRLRGLVGVTVAAEEPVP